MPFKSISKDLENYIVENYYNLSSKELVEKTKLTKQTIIKYAKLNGLEIKKYIKPKFYHVNQNYFEKIDTEDKAYWLGFLYADGYVRKRKTGFELRLKLKRSDRKHIELFRKSINSTHIIKDLTSDVKVDGKIHTSLCSTLSIYDNKIVNDLYDKGCVNNKTFIIKIPKLGKKLMRHFIRGYFDGDGSIGMTQKNYYRFGITSGSKIMLEEINNLFTNLGLNNRKIYNYKKSYTLSVKSANDLSILYNWLYKDATIFLNRKKNIFDNVINLIEKRKYEIDVKYYI
jgi:DNA-binding transcriptional regulator WhiA